MVDGTTKPLPRKYKRIAEEIISDVLVAFETNGFKVGDAKVLNLRIDGIDYELKSVSFLDLRK